MWHVIMYIMNILIGDSTQLSKMFPKAMNQIKQIWFLLRAPMHPPWIPESSWVGRWE